MENSHVESGEQILHSSSDRVVHQKLLELMRSSNAFDGRHWNRNLLTYLTPANFARTIYLTEIYRKIIEIPGYILEAGVLYGSTSVSLLNLRAIFEPYNHTRKLISFDTFEGFPAVTEYDSKSVKKGDYSTLPGWEEQLVSILEVNEQLSPLNHIKKFEVIKGDVSSTLPKWLQENPGAPVALLHLDLDLYKPTKDVLELVFPRLVRGSIIAFDEFADSDWPGETLAFFEKFPLNMRLIKRSHLQNNCAYLVIE